METKSVQTAHDHLVDVINELRNEMQMLLAGHYRSYTFLIPPTNVFVSLSDKPIEHGISLTEPLPETLVAHAIGGQLRFFLDVSQFKSVQSVDQVNDVTRLTITTDNNVGGSESYDFGNLVQAIMAARIEDNEDVDTGEHHSQTDVGLKRIAVAGAAAIARQIEVDPEENKEYQSYFLHHQSGDMFDTIVFGANAVYSEQVFAMLIDRFEHLDSQLPHPANQQTIDHLKAALKAQTDRYAARKEAGTYGTDQV